MSDLPSVAIPAANGMSVMVYDDELATLNRIFAEYPEGGLSVLCPTCKEELIVVLDVDDVKTHRLGPGIYCRKNHLRSLFHYRGT
jgi:hypothetical protein